MNRTADAKSARSRSEYWRELVRQQEGSGQSVHAFCAARGFTEQSFYHWKKRLNKDAPVSFALVTSDGSNSIEGSLLELDFGSGQRLRIPRGADAATLRNAHCQVKKKRNICDILELLIVRIMLLVLLIAGSYTILRGHL